MQGYGKYTIYRSIFLYMEFQPLFQPSLRSAIAIIITSLGHRYCYYYHSAFPQQQPQQQPQQSHKSNHSNPIRATIAIPQQQPQQSHESNHSNNHSCWNFDAGMRGYMRAEIPSSLWLATQFCMINRLVSGEHLEKRIMAIIQFFIIFQQQQSQQQPQRQPQQ